MTWEDRHVGVWSDGVGTEIQVAKVKERRFLVSFLRNGHPVTRSWMDNRPALDMPALYTEDALDGSDFAIELGPTGTGYKLHLTYEEFNYLDPDGGEIISTAVSGPDCSQLDTLGEYSKLFLCNNLLHRVS